MSARFPNPAGAHSTPAPVRPPVPPVSAWPLFLQANLYSSALLVLTLAVTFWGSACKLSAFDRDSAPQLRAVSARLYVDQQHDAASIVARLKNLSHRLSSPHLLAAALIWHNPAGIAALLPSASAPRALAPALGVFRIRPPPCSRTV